MEVENLEPAQIISLLADFSKLAQDAYRRNSDDMVLPIYKMLVEDAMLFWAHYREEYEKMDDKSNIAVSNCIVSHDHEKFIQFDTIRNNETVTVDIDFRKIELKFYDDDLGGKDKYCLELGIHKRLANEEKLQQEFSTFLASENPNMIDFITDTIWRHIDESNMQKERNTQRRRERSNRFKQKTAPRENNTRYSFRGQKIDEEEDRMEQNVGNQNRRETRSMRKNAV